MAVSKNWLTLLFKRFEEIYVDRCASIDKTLSLWEEALENVSADQIKHALIVCREDTSILPTPSLFKSLCINVEGWKSISDNNNRNSSSINPTATSSNPHSVVPLQWPSKKPIATKEVSDNQQKEEWKQSLMAMNDVQALSLSGSDRYDRGRLLMEKYGREQVIRLQALAPVNKPEIKRKDWG